MQYNIYKLKSVVMFFCYFIPSKKSGTVKILQFAAPKWSCCSLAQKDFVLTGSIFQLNVLIDVKISQVEEF